MKTFAIIALQSIDFHDACATQGAILLRDKLSRLYKHEAECLEALSRHQSTVKAKTRYETEARVYRHVSDELLKLEITSEPPAIMTAGTFI